MSVIEDFFDALYTGDTATARQIMDECRLPASITDAAATGQGQFEGVPALHYVVQKGDIEFAKDLIERGANVNAFANGAAALHWATTPECVDLLIKHGADINAKLAKDLGTGVENKGGTALHLAAAAGNSVLVGALLQHKKIKIAAKDAAGNTPLHLAANGHAEAARMLLLAGADLSITNKEGKTAAQILNEKIPGLTIAAENAAPTEDRTADNGTTHVRNAAEQSPHGTENAIVRAEVPQQTLPEVATEEEERSKRVAPAVTDIPQNEVNAIARAGERTEVEVDAIMPVKAGTGKGEAANDANRKALGEKPKYMEAGSLLNGKFIRDEIGNYRRLDEERIAFVDEGERVRFVDKQMDAFQAGIKLAKLKDWQAIQVTGTDQFRSEAWFYARMEGLQVLGYEPKPADLSRLQAAQEQSAKTKPITKGQESAPSDEELNHSAARDYALKEVGGMVNIDKNKFLWSGKVPYQNDHYFVQSLGKGQAAVHAKADFSKADLDDMLKTNESVRIRYSGGRARIDAGKDKTIGAGLGR